MNVLKIVLVVMIIMSALAFTQGCADKTDDVPDTDINTTNETIVEPDVVPAPTDGVVVEEAITGTTEEDTTSKLPEREPDTQIIWIKSYSFSPRDPVIYVGDSLNWINDENTHISYKLVSEDGLWDNKSLGRGNKFSYTFNESGVYNYSIPGYGNSLKGSVTVVEYNENTAILYDDPLSKGIVAVD